LPVPPADTLAIAVPLASALVAAAASVFAVLWTQRATRRTNERIATLNGELAEQRDRLSAELAEQRDRLNAELARETAVEKAKQDYDFEALKRLYAECEPLLFQTLELAEEARSRIESLARSARGGFLQPDGGGWLARPGYFYKSTAFMLLAPITSYKILQRRLTSIDLGLDRGLRTEYELLKLIFLSFTRDFDLARRDPELPYLPDRADPGERDRDELLRSEPQVYWRQGFYRGIVEMLSEALIAPAEQAGRGPGSRCKSMGEFWAELPDPDSSIGRVAGEIDALLRGFHPLRRPVLWRVLVAQHRLYDVFLATKRADTGSPVFDLPPETFKTLDWRRDEGEEVDADAVRAPILAADAYVREQVTKALTTPRRSPTAR
jgi:hypothetical protein